MEKETLEKFLQQNLDATEIAKQLNCSRNKIIYWLNKFNLKTNRQESIKNDYLTKFCSKCKKVKNKEDFYALKENKLSPYCIECKSNSSKKLRIDFKLELVLLKGGKCCICGYNKCIAALDFHHLDPSKKELSFNKSRLKLDQKIKDELDKCILVCSNCHREIHYNNLKIEEILEK